MSYKLSPEIIKRFYNYLQIHPVWGSLHIVLDDFNIDDSSCCFCLDYAEKNGDTEGAFLASELLKMSKTQRLKMAHDGYFKDIDEIKP